MGNFIWYFTIELLFHVCFVRDTGFYQYPEMDTEKKVTVAFHNGGCCIPRVQKWQTCHTQVHQKQITIDFASSLLQF